MSASGAAMHDAMSGSRLLNPSIIEDGTDDDALPAIYGRMSEGLLDFGDWAVYSEP